MPRCGELLLARPLNLPIPPLPNQFKNFQTAEQFGQLFNRSGTNADCGPASVSTRTETRFDQNIPGKPREHPERAGF